MTAEVIAKALCARPFGGGWMACCPAHDDRSPSLSIRDTEDGKTLVYCHAGCDQKQVIAVLRSQGLWGADDARPVSFDSPKPRHAPATSGYIEDAQRTKAALSIWTSASPADGTPVEDYLGSRGLRCPPASTLRFHSALKHPSGGFWPAMIALVTRGSDDTPLGVHRTFLARDGLGKAPVDPPKMMLGPCGGGAVRLGQAGGSMMVGEGIETCLAAMVATGYPAWAALSTSGLRALELPTAVRDVLVLADGDRPGKAAARDCARRWTREGRRVRIARPPAGMDFNDLLMGPSPQQEGAS